MSGERRHDRLFTVQFDSLLQAVQYERAEHENEQRAVRQRFSAVARVGALLAQTLVLTDTQILDGRYFLDIGPNGLARVLGSATLDDRDGAAAEIQTRERTLSASLRALVRDPASKATDPCIGFEFAALSTESRSDVAANLKSVLASQFDTYFVNENDSATGMARLLVSCGAHPREADRLREGWVRWFEAEDRGTVRTARFGTPVAEFASQFTKKPDWLWKALLFSESRDWLDRQFATVDCPERRFDPRYYKRSAFYDHLRSSAGKDPTDRKKILYWYDISYQRAIARQHDAELIDVAGFDIDYELLKLRLGKRTSNDVSRAAALPNDMAKKFVSMPASVYEAIRYCTATAREEFSRKGSAAALRHIAYAVIEASRERNPANVRMGAIVKTTFVVLIGLVALFPLWPLAVKGALILLAAIASNYDDIRLAIDLRPKRLDAVIDVEFS